MPVIYVACGAYYSLAITHENRLYGWGEARLGQLGIGKKTMYKLPQHIPVFESEEVVNRKTVSQISVRTTTPKLDTNEVAIVSCAAGFGHTAAITTEGELFMWGFNIYGQLGTGDKKTRWGPERIERDIVGNLMPQIQKVACGYYSTFVIDFTGRLYSWGRGNIGHKGKTDEDLPRKIELNTENRIFTDVFCNETSTAFYAPVRVYSISPKCGPAHGGTILSIMGTGLVENEKLKVRFSYGDLSQEVACSFDSKMKSLFCKTPKFEEFEGQTHPSLKLPCDCIISVTTDGINYSECEEPFKIYSNDITLSSIAPKCGSVRGGTELTLLINIDPVTAESLFHLNVGFQAKVAKGA